MSAPGRIGIQRVPASATHALRHRVLRPHQPVYAGFPHEDDPDTGNFAAVDGHGMVIGCVTVHLEAPPPGVGNGGPPTAPGAAWRLRGMATAEAHRQQGVGSSLMAAAVAYIAERRGTLLWCRARLAAVPFYRNAGFVASGEPWEEPDIGPHVVMWRTIEPSS
jgi:hypothetical protein